MNVSAEMSRKKRFLRDNAADRIPGNLKISALAEEIGDFPGIVDLIQRMAEADRCLIELFLLQIGKKRLIVSVDADIPVKIFFCLQKFGSGAEIFDFSLQILQLVFKSVVLIRRIGILC